MPSSTHSAVCSKCFLYFAPADLRRHVSVCTGQNGGGGGGGGVAPSAPPQSTAVTGGEGRVVVYKVQKENKVFLKSESEKGLSFPLGKALLDPSNHSSAMTIL